VYIYNNEKDVVLIPVEDFNIYCELIKK